MDLSKPPKDILGLGKHLVRELDFEDGVDTLGRWMAHHIAELIYESENGKTAVIRSKAYRQAVETILKIWEHRKTLPREAYPLAKFEDLLKVIDRLQISSNPYRFERYNFQDGKDQIASMLFDDLTRLIITLLLMKLDSVNKQKEASDKAIEALDEQEKLIWLAIRDWMTIFPSESKKEKPVKNNPKTKKKSSEVDLKRTLCN